MDVVPLSVWREENPGKNPEDLGLKTEMELVGGKVQPCVKSMLFKAGHEVHYEEFSDGVEMREELESGEHMLRKNQGQDVYDALAQSDRFSIDVTNAIGMQSR